MFTWGNSVNNNGVPGLRKLCIFQFTTNDENMNLWVYPERDPENIAYLNLLTVKRPFGILDIIRLQKSTMKSSCVRGGARGAYLAHGLYQSNHFIHTVGCNSSRTHRDHVTKEVWTI